MTFRGFRYYKVRVSGTMSSANIHRTCELRGYVTPCTGRGGKSFHPPVSTSPVKGIKMAVGNSKSFIGLRDSLSSLCQRRYGPNGRVDARCDDGWAEEGKAAGKPVCEDENTNTMLPCSMLAESCRMPSVQAKCALTCNTFDKGSKECKQIGQEKDQFKCVRSFSCQAFPTVFVPQGMVFTKPRAGAQDGCGLGAKLELAMCSNNPKKVVCGCPSAYEMTFRSLSTSDCSSGDYDAEGKRILAKLGSISEQTSQWAASCTGIPESAKPYVSKMKQPSKLEMKDGKAIVWKLSEIHSMSMSMDKDGCDADFTMAVSVCNTAPFKRLVLEVPFTGVKYVTVGCGCQEILARATYDAQIKAMENKMQATQDTCAKHFVKWTHDFNNQYFFGGLNYYAHAIRLAKEIRTQCVDAGIVAPPDVKYQHRRESIQTAMNQNQKAIAKQEVEVQKRTEKVLRLQKTKQQCLAKLPKDKHYKELVDEFSMTDSHKDASELKDEVDQLNQQLTVTEMNKAKLHEMSAKP